MSTNSSENSKDANFTRFLQVSEQRLQTMRTLGDEVRQSSDAVVNLDVLRLERVSDRERQLCDEMRMLNGELMEVEPQIVSPNDEIVPPRELQTKADEMRRQMSGLQAEIARLSRIHQAVLRRARRSAQVMANVVAFCLP